MAAQYEARFWAKVKVEKHGIIAIGGHACFDDTVDVEKSGAYHNRWTGRRSTTCVHQRLGKDNDRGKFNIR